MNGIAMYKQTYIHSKATLSQVPQPSQKNNKERRRQVVETRRSVRTASCQLVARRPSNARMALAGRTDTERTYKKLPSYGTQPPIRYHSARWKKQQRKKEHTETNNSTNSTAALKSCRRWTCTCVASRSSCRELVPDAGARDGPQHPRGGIASGRRPPAAQRRRRRSSEPALRHCRRRRRR